jgi:uncharacterized damage-inducible protein DinB
MSISQMLLPEFDQEMAKTRKTLERIPEHNLTYKPHAKSMPLDRLAGHIAEMPTWGTTTLTTDSIDMDLAAYQPLVATSAAQVLAAFDANVAALRGHIANTSDQAFLTDWPMSVNGQHFMTMPRMAVIRAMVINHIIHHRAQLGVYLRLNNIEVPGMYGASADEPNMFASAQA